MISVLFTPYSNNQVQPAVLGFPGNLQVPKVTFHTLRHTLSDTCIGMLVQKGVDIYHVKELLGHSSIASTERYSHLSDSTLKHAALMIQGD